MPAPATQSRREVAPRDFAAIAGFCLFVGGGSSLLLWHLHAWFYDFVTTTLAILFDSAGALLALAATSGRWGARRQSRIRPAYLIALLTLWFVPAYWYLSGADLAQLVRDSQAAREYWRDPSCNERAMREVAKRKPSFDQDASQPESSTQSICKTGWTKVEEKSPFHSCLVLHGSAVYGNYCGYGRFRPAFDWASIRVGDALVAQTAYGRPSAYFFESKDATDLIVNPRGVVFLTSTNPDQEFRQHLSHSILFIGFYLMLGGALVTRLIG